MAPKMWASYLTLAVFGGCLGSLLVVLGMEIPRKDWIVIGLAALAIGSVIVALFAAAGVCALVAWAWENVKEHRRGTKA